LPDKVAITVGVVYHGAPCWIVRGEFEGKGRTAPIVRYWVRKDHPRLLQVEWRDGKDRPVRQVAIVPGEAGGVGFAERITVRPAEGGAWTELVAQASAFDAFPDLGGAPESAFDDPEKLDAQWP
jgi:hypothetical protein